MAALRKDQASIGLFDPQPGAMAGVNQELQLKMFNRIRTIGIGPSALFGPKLCLNSARTAAKSLCFVVDQVPLTHP
jgi:hypothetical protein